MDEEELSILGFNRNKKKITFGAAVLPPLSTNVRIDEASSDSDSDWSYGSGDGEGTRRRRRKRSHTVGGESGSLASRLIHHEAIVIEDDEDSDGVTSPTKRAKKNGSKDVFVVDSDSSLSHHSSSPSPQPSPPPPGIYLDATAPTDKRSRKVLDKANIVLNQLRYSTESYYLSPSLPDYSIDLNDSISSAGATPPFRLRIRCRGKIHKFNVPKTDPFSHVCALLLTDLKEDDTQKVLLSHKTSTIKQTESPASLGLTTADILDAAIMTKSSIADVSTGSLNDSQDSTGSAENITVTLRSSKKSTEYNLSKSQPLQKAMTAFASELGISITKLKFIFDGDPVDPTKSAQDMDMEDEDCIDVTVTA